MLAPRVLWVAGVATLTSACATTPILPAEVAAPAPTATAITTEPVREPATGFARVLDGTKLHVAPSDKSDHAVLVSRARSAKGFTPSATVRVLGETGAFVKVETVGPDVAPSCGRPIGALEGYQLTFYVKRNRLQTVVTRRTTVELPGSGRVTLEAGTPVALTGGAAVASVAPDRLFVSLDRGVVGRYFQPSPSPEPVDPARFVTAQTRLAYGEHELAIDGHRMVGLWQLIELSEEKRPQATLSHPCAEVTGRVISGLAELKRPSGVLGLLSAGEIGTIGGVFGESGLGGGPTRTEYEAPIGIPVIWQNGKPAGKVVRRQRLGSRATRKGSSLCFRSPKIGGDDDPPGQLDLCFAEADLESKEITSPYDSLSGTDVGESFGVGGLGLKGTGRGGGGTGEGIGGLGTKGVGSGYGRRAKSRSSVKQGKPTTTGDLDKDIIRRIVRAHINEIRYCYEKELARDPKLKGKVTVRWTIASDGVVAMATVQKSTLNNKAVESCMTQSIGRWKFPRTGGGKQTTIVYPFVFEISS